MIASTLIARVRGDNRDGQVLEPPDAVHAPHDLVRLT